MKNKFILRSCATALLLTTVNLHLSNAFAQGALMPPGAPAPTMKSLAQIEPRTPISAVPFTISAPGSYYLTTNLTGGAFQSGIFISANNVVLDLDGFALQGAAGSTHGIYISGSYSNIIIRNGTVSGWGNFGVNGYSSGFPRNVIYEHLTILGGTVGLYAEADSIIRDCVIMNSSLNGISSVGSLITGCVVRDNGSFGMNVMNSTVRACSLQFNGNGITMDHSTVADCDIIKNATNGVIAASTCHLIGNRIADHNNPINGIGFTLTGPNNVVTDNAVLNNTTCLYVAGVSNCIVQNKFIGNAGSFYAAPNSYIVNANNVFPVTVLTSGSAFTSANPWINIIY